MTDEQQAERGRLAQDVLSNPIYADSYALIEAELTRVWRDSRDPVEREDLHKLLRMLDKARNVLETAMRTGRVAEEELKRKRTLAERVMRR